MAELAHLERPVIATGIALLALVVATGSFAEPLFQDVWSDSPDPEPVCEVPVELVDAIGVRLACADSPELSHCGALQLADRVVIEEACRVEAGAMRAAMRLMLGLPLNLNRCSQSDLQLLNGIGPSLAKAIVVYRDEYGPFERLSDLTRVRGIGPVLQSRLKPYLTAD